MNEIDIKRYCRIEKIPGGTIEDCKVIKGVILNKDVVHAKVGITKIYLRNFSVEWTSLVIDFYCMDCTLFELLIKLNTFCCEPST